jgi:hypothetical protein
MISLSSLPRIWEISHSTILSALPEHGKPRLIEAISWPNCPDASDRISDRRKTFSTQIFYAALENKKRPNESNKANPLRTRDRFLQAGSLTAHITEKTKPPVNPTAVVSRPQAKCPIDSQPLSTQANAIRDAPRPAIPNMAIVALKDQGMGCD